MPLPPLWLVVFAASTAYSVIGRTRLPRDEREDGLGPPGDFNVSDGTAPIGMGYGAPEIDPHVLFDYQNSDKVNSRTPADDVRRYIGLSLGGANVAGLDGRELVVYQNDVRLFQRVDGDTPVLSRTLTEVEGSDGRAWRFPHSNIITNTVAVKADDIVVHAGPNSGSTVDESHILDIAKQKVAPRLFANQRKILDPTFTIDTSIPNKGSDSQVRPGGALPAAGSLDAPIRVGVYFKKDVWPRIPGVTREAVRSIDPLPDDAVHVGGLVNFGKGNRQRYFYVQSDLLEATKAKGYPWMVAQYPDGIPGARDHISHFLVSMSSKPVAELVENDDGTLEIRFAESQTGKTLTWTGEVSAIQEQEAVYHFRDGKPDQEPLPFENGARNTYPVGFELTKNAVATYTTKSKVHDAVVGITSGSSGFFDVSESNGNFYGTSRGFRIRIREDGAADDFADATKDPADGWVTIWTDSLKGNHHNGIAPWFFGVEALLAKLRNDPDYRLPYAKYEISVVSTTLANELNAVNDLFLANVTEVQRVQVSVPHHSSLTVEIKNPRDLAANPVYRVGLAMRRVWVPDADAVLADGDELPQPGAWRWTRNPVWCACDLITDKLFAKGEFFTWANINLEAAQTSAAFCDDEVPIAFGATETEARSEVDYYIGAYRSLLSHVQDLLRGSQVMPTLSGGTWRFVPDRDDEPVLLPDTDRGIVESIHLDERTIRARYPSLEELPTEVAVNFADPDNRFEPTPLDIPNEGESDQRVVTTLDLLAVRRATQAARQGELYRRQVKFQRFEFEAAVKPSGYEMIQYESGDITPVTSPIAGITAKPMRIQHMGKDSQGNIIVRCTEHASIVYQDTAKVPNSAVKPGSRPPPPASAATVRVGSDESATVIKQQVVPAVSGVALRRVARRVHA